MHSVTFANLTTLVPNFHEDIKYTDENEQQIVEVIAERTATIYAEFLTLAGHNSRSKQLKFYDFPKLLPSEEEVKTFKRHLKATIIERLSARSEYGDIVRLLVDHVPSNKTPSDILDTVVEKSGVGMKSKYSQVLFQFFPMKSSTTIAKLPSAKVLRIEMQSFDRGL